MKVSPVTQSAKILKMFSLAALLGWQDVRQTYRRSALGPFWITASMTVQIATMGLVFGLIFDTEISEYLPYLSVSIVIWGFISAVVTEGCLSFIAAEGMIRQLNIPLMTFVLRVIWKNIIVLAHNFAILPLVFLIFGKGINTYILLFVPGIALLTLNLLWIAAIMGMLSARFRDLPPIAQSATLVAFYVTPVMWLATSIPQGTAHLLLGLNPLYHLLQIVRLPILGEAPTLENWLISIALLVIGACISSLVFRRYRKLVAYWV